MRHLFAKLRPGHCFALLLLVHVGLAVHSLWQKSVTVDEYAHLPAGCSYLQQGTFILYHHNPPLVKMLAALPTLAGGAKVDYSRHWLKPWPPSQWLFGEDFQAANANRFGESGVRYHFLFNLGRLVIVALSCVAGWLIYRWADELYGQRGALVAAAVWCLSPNVLAHARLITTDLGAAVAFVASLYVLWRWQARGGRQWMVGGGVVLGLAQLTKFTCLLLYPLSLVLILVWHAATPRSIGRRLSRKLAEWLGMVGVSVLVINAGYLGEGVFKPLGDYEFLSRTLTVPRPQRLPGAAADPREEYLATRVNRFRGSMLGQLPVPLPFHYVAGFDEQKWESETEVLPDGKDKGYPVFLNGEHRRRGWWYYYLACVMYKLPIPTMFWLGVATVTGFMATPRVRIMADGTFLLTMALVFAAMSFLTDINLGVRYILPLWPFLCLWIGRLGNVSWRDSRLGRTLLPAVVVLGLLPVVRIHPHYLSYFNEIAGGPVNGRYHLIDSNLDWGQDLVALKRFMEQQGIDRIWLAYFGNEDPRAARIDFGLPPGPQPGWNAVSVNYVMGLPYGKVRDGHGNWRRLGDRVQQLFTAYQQFRPIARAGYSIDLYYLTPEDIARAKLTGTATTTRPPRRSAK